MELTDAARARDAPDVAEREMKLKRGIKQAADSGLFGIDRFMG